MGRTKRRGYQVCCRTQIFYFRVSTFQRKKFSFNFVLKTNASMKVTPKMAATLPDSNDTDEAIPLNHPTKKSSARKSKIKVYSGQNADIEISKTNIA